ncbi:tetratricopeptide repeat protein [Cephaloticoccus primus]|uniref:tetratricopeptide repeat protein n=1 Tax=Cephaloticoccus primus TaxID=1548207 RepID=UPI0018D31319|nr:hypothetical protein [Cephaloticoccus primus]
MRTSFLAAALGLALLGSPSLHATEDSALANAAWEDVTKSRITDASKKFEKLYEADPGNPRFAVAHAAALLGRDPVTRANVRRARTILVKVAADLPVSETEYRPLALFLLGRIDHDQVQPVQFESARAFYEQLRSEYPGHPLADHAAFQLAQLLYLELPQSRVDEVLAFIDQIMPELISESLQRELCIWASELCADDELKIYNEEASLRYLLKARYLDADASPYESGEMDLQIAGTARRIGQRALAAKHYRAFAESSPRDTRAYTARRLARELEEAEAAAQTNRGNE